MANRLARTVWKNRATQSAWRAASWTLLGLMLFIALAGCVNLPSAATAASAAAVKNNSLKGTAKLLERTVLPANSIFEATLEEAGSFGAPANVISTDSRQAAGVSAVNFSIQFSDSQIRPGRRYAVRGRVLVNGQLLFASEQPMAVLASPHDRTVTITLIRPTLPPAPTAARTPSRAPGNTADNTPAPPAARAAEQKSNPQASRKELQARAQELGAWAAEGRALQTDRSGLFFTAFLSNIQVLDCKIGKNYPRWGQFSLCAPSAAQAPSRWPGTSRSSGSGSSRSDARPSTHRTCPNSSTGRNSSASARVTHRQRRIRVTPCRPISHPAGLVPIHSRRGHV